MPGALDTFNKLESYFGDFEKAWGAGEAEMRNANISSEAIIAITNKRNQINPDKEWQRLADEGIVAISKDSSQYPQILKEISKHPRILYIRGCLPLAETVCLGVVGSRKYSTYGRQGCEKIISELAGYGITIISGLALGIDSIAHQTALDNSINTVAVLGTGIDDKSIYPAQNFNLAKDILKSGGAIISEFAMGTKGLPHHFPMRNRIISGLSQGVMIVEAGEKSGSLITANYALEQNREVFAIPGQIFSDNSSGTNNLIRQGARITTSAKDILEEFNISSQMNLNEVDVLSSDTKNLSLVELEILKLLSREPIELDLLLKTANIPASQFNSILTMLEIKGIIKNRNGRIFKIK